MADPLPLARRIITAIGLMLPVRATYVLYAGLRLLPSAYFLIVTRLLPVESSR